MISVIYPPEAEATEQKSVTEAKKNSTQDVAGRGTQEEILVIHLTGIKNKERLTEIAKAIYEELNRGELGGSCETNNVYSIGGENEDDYWDMLMIRPGDGVQFLVDTRALSSRSPLVSAVNDFARMSFNEAVNQVANRLGNGPGDNQLARVLVATARGLVFELSTYFRVSTVRLNWSSDSGVKISFDFHNYIEVTQQERSIDDLPMPSSQYLDLLRKNVGKISSSDESW